MRMILLVFINITYSRPTFGRAVEHCISEDANLQILNILDSGLAHYGHVDPLATETDRNSFINHTTTQQEFEARRNLSVLINEAEQMGVSADATISWGSPIAETVRMAHEYQAEIVVMEIEPLRRLNPFSLINRIERRIHGRVETII